MAWCSKAVDMMCFLPFFFSRRRGRKQRLVVRFASAGGKCDFFRIRVQAFCYDCPGALHLAGSRLAKAVDAGGISVLLSKAGQHRIDGGLAHFCSGRIVGIDLH